MEKVQTDQDAGLMMMTITYNNANIFAGSGRVTFSSAKSYLKAVSAAFVEVKTPKFTKKVSV